MADIYDTDPGPADDPDKFAAYLRQGARRPMSPFSTSDSPTMSSVDGVALHDVSRDRMAAAQGIRPGTFTKQPYHVVVGPDGVNQNAPLGDKLPHAGAFNGRMLGVAYNGDEGEQLPHQGIVNMSDTLDQIDKQYPGGLSHQTHYQLGPTATATSKNPLEGSYGAIGDVGHRSPVQMDMENPYPGDPGGADLPRYSPMSEQELMKRGYPVGNAQLATRSLGPLRRPPGQPVPDPTRVTARSVPTQSIGPGQSPVAPAETPIERVAEAARPTRNNSAIATADAPSIKEQIAAMTKGLQDTPIPGTDATLKDTASLFTGAGKGLMGASGMMGGMGGLGSFGAALAGGGSDKQAHELEQKAAKDREGTVKSYVEQRKKAAAEAMAALLGKKKQQSPFGVA